MTKEALKIAIEKSLKSENFIFLTPLEDRLTNLLALEITKNSAFWGINQYPFKAKDSGRASKIDLVCFSKKTFTWIDENIIWGLEAKLCDPYQRTNMNDSTEWSLGGAKSDRKKFLEILKFEKKKFIVLFQVEIVELPQNESDLIKTIQCCKYAGNSYETIKKSIERFKFEDFFKELKVKCETEFKVNIDEGSCGSVKIKNYPCAIHFIIIEL